MAAGKKVFKIFGIVFISLILILAITYINLNKSELVTAQLSVESGSVLVNNQAVQDTNKLKQGDVIETKEGSLATVILYESIIIGLEENTKITLEDLSKAHPKVKQDSGSTWNKFTKLMGMQDYSISSGNTVASVRGTFFKFKKGQVITGEGNVSVEEGNETDYVGNGEVLEINDSGIIKRKMNSTEFEEFDKNTNRTIEQLRKLRQKEIEKHPRILAIVKDRFNVTDEMIQTTLIEADEGKVDIEAMKAKSPIKIKSIEKIVIITKKIQELKKVN